MTEPPATAPTAVSTPAATLSQPTLDRYAQYAETTGKAAIGLSIIVYVVGFMVVVPYYTRSGVPAKYIDHVTFLAAGILTVVVNGLAALAGVVMRFVLPPAYVRFWHWSKEDLRRVGVGTFVTIFSIGALLVGVLGVRHLPDKLVALGTSFTVGFGLGSTPFSVCFISRHFQSPRLRKSLDIVVLGSSLLASISTFSYLVFPYVPIQFGGGLPDLIARVTIPLTDPLPAESGWMEQGCRSGTSSDPTVTSCRLFFRVHETTEFLFLAVAEVPGACESKEATTTTDVDAASHAKCFLRLSNATLPRLESIHEK